MTGAVEVIKDHALNQPVSFTIAVAIPLGFWYYGAFSGAFLNDIAAPICQRDSTTKALSIYTPAVSPDLATVQGSTRTTPVDAVLHIFRRPANIFESPPVTVLSFSNTSRCLDTSYPRLLAAVIVAALPETSKHLIDCFPIPWAQHHRAFIASVVHFIAFVGLANRGLGLEDVLGIALMMVGFEIWQCALTRSAADQTKLSHMEPYAQTSSATETLLDRNTSAPTAGNFGNKTIIRDNESGPVAAAICEDDATQLRDTDARDREIVRLQRTLTEIKTTNEGKDMQLRLAKEDLHNAREALNETFTEYSSLREEMKTVRQTLGKDHQAIIYRKDIELFALRKGNEQKERYIEERNAKLQDMVRQQKTTIEVQDAQLKVLKERIIAIEQQTTPKLGQEAENGDHALEVRLLRVKKGRNSPTHEDDKDVIISKLQDELSLATRAAQDIINQQAELQRAWDIAKKVQTALKEERERHTQTREQLEEAEVKLANSESQRREEATRLPTIVEDEHDHDELKAMFDSAQADNLRLYAEVEALERRLKDSNARLFSAQGDADALRETLRSEQAITSDMEAARPSVVHRVHFQRMEGQLSEIREALAIKDEVIEGLERMIAEKNEYIKELRDEVDAAVTFHTQDQDDIERLKRMVAELKETKQQLMYDHERVAAHRTRPRSIVMDRTSNRSSSATLIQEVSPALTRLPDEPASRSASGATAPIPNSSSTDGNKDAPFPLPEPTDTNPRTPRTIHEDSPTMPLRSQSSPSPLKNIISTAVPPSPLRDNGNTNEKKSRRKSLGLKDLMKRMTRKESETLPSAMISPTLLAKDNSRMRGALSPKERNVSVRPHTGISVTKSMARNAGNGVVERPMTAAMSSRPGNGRKLSDRYYASQTDLSKGSEQDQAENAAERATSRMSWGAATKLKRKSVL